MSNTRPHVRFLLALLALACAAAAYYDEPPIANVTEHNLAVAESLGDHFVPAAAVNGTVYMLFNGTDKDWAQISESFEFPLAHASARIVAMDPSVDNYTSAAASPVLLVAWGAQADGLPQGDYEEDDCNESQLSSSVSHSAEVTFSFGNASEKVIVTNNRIPVPASVLDAMRNSSGNGDALEVRLNATFLFRYDIDDRTAVVEGGCADRVKIFYSTLSINDTMDWGVEGNRTLFILRRPVLGEQWYRDNRFDVILLSDARFYAGSVSGPGNQSYAFRLCAFDVANDSFGAWHAVSVPLGTGHDGIAGHEAENAPVPLSRGNFTYSYVYEFNYSYQGLGWNTLVLEARTVFGAKRGFSQAILSRALTYSGNLAENGAYADPPVSVPSASWSADYIKPLALGMGVAALLLAALLMGRVHGRKK